MMGFSPSACPREMDGVHIHYTVWRCQGAVGSCSTLEEEDDPMALVCEFGPDGIKEGLKNMVPGESRRFWISKEAKDRRFGRPAPERFLPHGDLVVDITLQSIDREAVFDYQLSDEALELCQERERRPVEILKRGLGVAIQILPWVYIYFSSKETNPETLPIVSWSSDFVNSIQVP
eukprot:gb/GFBE01062444.1/.p1 GENE.gb/GFBE01062444.1/~~gb/GFBE01062444.1/.p1  ORF type:complete len:176 (+),score=40.41 gb/GFBE01062444.1/:1-528(+)